jgi:hypothetical protein
MLLFLSDSTEVKTASAEAGAEETKIGLITLLIVSKKGKTKVIGKLERR